MAQTRRRFLKTLAAAATVTVAGTKASGKVLGANETIRIAVAGLNGRGSSHVGAFSGMKDVQVAYLVDPDSRTFGRHLKTIAGRGAAAPRTVPDVRTALEDKNLDALSIATPNHWHALMTIWGAQHGKHVYVEKPCSHNVHEGRIAVEMARKHNVIVQHGTQSRSSQAWANTIAVIKSGKLGRLLVSRGLCYKGRGSIGTRLPEAPPREVNFDLWLGPAQRHPFHRNLVHYNWHWFWDFGNGDIGNQGVHQMDIARWALPDDAQPQSVLSLGGRFGYTDQGETPNTQMAVFDYGPTKLIFEVRGLRTNPFHGQGIGNIFHLEEGIIAGNNTFYPRGSTRAAPMPRVDPAPRGPGGGNHYANFIAAVRSGRREDLNADILDGHLSSALGHLANASYRLGAEASFEPRPASLGKNADAVDTLVRMEEHLGENRLKLESLRLRVGRRLEIDPRTERIRGDDEANRLLTRQYREPFTVPDRVG